MKLNNSQIICFGIANNESYCQATSYAKGAIIGSAFIKYISKHGINSIKGFIKLILKK